uniref:Chromo domain-containing protein n=1 Tax=Parascaris univalens TaxID=6257 RepID=A0A915BC82_PARUN
LCGKMRTNNSLSHWLRHKKTKSVSEEFDSDEFEAEQIIDKRVSPCGRHIHYLVKWKEYPISESTWEPPANLVNCKELIREYERSHGNEKRYRLPVGRKRNRKSVKTTSHGGKTLKVTIPCDPRGETTCKEGNEKEGVGQSGSISEREEVAEEVKESAKEEMKEEKPNSDRFQMVVKVVKMNKFSDDELSYEAEFHNGARE